MQKRQRRAGFSRIIYTVGLKLKSDGCARFAAEKKNRKWNGNVEYVETQFILFCALSHRRAKNNHQRTRIRLQLKAPKYKMN